MGQDQTRRRYLAGVGTVAGIGGLAQTGTAQESCPDVASLEETVAETRSQVTALEDERRTLESDRIPALEADLETARETYIDRQHRHDDATIAAARELGLEVRPSVVWIQVDYAGSADFAMSTAWYVEPDLLLTNAHNVADAAAGDTLSGWTVDGTEFTFDVVDLVASRSPDVALLRTDEPGPALPTGDAATLSQGDLLLQVGHPGDLGNWALTLGEFEGFGGGFYDTETTFQSTVPGMGGTSGSPVLTMDGTVVGMTFAGPPGLEGTGDPEPVELEVRTLPMPNRVQGGQQVRIETAMEKVEEWT